MLTLKAHCHYTTKPDILMRLQSFANVKLSPVDKSQLFRSGYTVDQTTSFQE
jgi:hypothetical protein